MSDDFVLLDRRDDGIAVLTFNDPDRLNAMTEAMGEAIAAAAKELSGDPGLRVVVLTGAGRAFSAGGDLDMISRMGDAGRADDGEQVGARVEAHARRDGSLVAAVAAAERDLDVRVARDGVELPRDRDLWHGAVGHRRQHHQHHHE